MVYALTEVPSTIRSYFDEDSPLGPVAAEHVRDPEVSAYLVSIENDAFVELSQGTAILFGRRGAGKSSLLNSFLFPSQIRTTSALSFEAARRSSRALDRNSDLKRDYDLVVKVNASKELEAVHSQVMKQSLPQPELAADEWSKRLWLNALWESTKHPNVIDKLSLDLQTTIKKLASLTNKIASLNSHTSYFDEWLSQRQDAIPPLNILTEQLRNTFNDKEIKVLFLIDTIEEYKFITTALNTTIAGLLYLVGVNRSSNVYYKIAFPYEIYDQVQGIANPEKLNLSTTTIRWTRAQLTRIVTRRMLLCLYLQENDNIDRILRHYKNIESPERSANFAFWNDVFSGDIANEAYQQEPALYYILRHTQLLPRQLISSLSWLMKLSKSPSTSYRYINHDIITDAMRSSCNTLIEGVESGFKFTYPRARDAFERFLRRCDICSDFDALHSIYANSSVKSGEEYTHDFYAFLRALLHMGVFGVVKTEIEGAQSDRYIEADFSYRDETVLRGFEARTFAMHPAFSLLYKEQSDRLKVGKAILPSGSIGHVE